MVVTIVAVTVALLGCSRSDQPSFESTAGEFPAPQPSDRRVVNLYNWADYIAPEVLQRFTAETGIEVTYDTFDSLDLAETKLLTGDSGYDVVVLSAEKVERLAPLGVFTELDYNLLPASRNLDPEVQAALALSDPGNRHAVAYLWGATGLGYDVRKLRELAPDAPRDSWQLIYEPKFASRMADCGVAVVDSPSDVISTALMSVGLDPNDLNDESLAQAERLLLALRPSIRKIDALLAADLVNGSLCLVIGWPSNLVSAIRQTREAGGKAELQFVIPREGTIRWIDTLAIPVDAPHPVEAHAFIDFLMRPENAAATANIVGSATANAAAMPLIDTTLREDPNLYPTLEARTRLKLLRARTLEESRAENRVWMKFRTTTE